MKHICYLVSALFSAQCLAADGSLCVSRNEDNGVLNIRPSQVLVDGVYRLQITGGQKTCIALSVGHHSVVVTSKDPYDPMSKNSNAWRSKPLDIVIQSKATIKAIIKPITKSATYTGPWSIMVVK